jgi:aminoglycoside phosphotransferase (APT) family kinase protein
VPVTPERRQLISAALDRDPTGLVEIDEGFDFEVVIADDEWVFRFPRRPQITEVLRMEIALLPSLADSLPVAIPRFDHISTEPLFVGYRVIRGTPLVDEDGQGVRAFLDALHSFDASASPLERPDWIASYRAQCDEFERLVVPLLDIDERAAASRLFGEVETLVGFEPALLHADLLPEHLLVHDGRLAGVIDWGDARIGDPALDYAWLLSAPFAGWDVDDELRRRAGFYHRLAPWYGAHYGVFVNKPAHVARALAQIRSEL